MSASFGKPQNRPLRIILAASCVGNRASHDPLEPVLDRCFGRVNSREDFTGEQLSSDITVPFLYCAAEFRLNLQQVKSLPRGIFSFPSRLEPTALEIDRTTIIIAIFLASLVLLPAAYRSVVWSQHDRWDANMNAGVGRDRAAREKVLIAFERTPSKAVVRWDSMEFETERGWKRPPRSRRTRFETSRSNCVYRYTCFLAQACPGVLRTRFCTFFRANQAAIAYDEGRISESTEVSAEEAKP